MKYMEKLKNEFNLATGLNDYKSFNNWLKEKKNHLERYSMVLDYLGLSNNDVTAEFDRGKFDNLILIDKYPIIEISSYANTIDYCSLVNFDGSFSVVNNRIALSNKNDISYIKIDSIKNYLMYLDDYSDKVYSLINLDKNIYYGFYSKYKDLDISNKKRYLEEVKEKVKYLRCNVANCETIIDDTYVNILKIKKKLY